MYPCYLNPLSHTCPLILYSFPSTYVPTHPHIHLPPSAPLPNTTPPPVVPPQGGLLYRATARMLSRFHDFQLEPAIHALFPLLGSGDEAALAAAKAAIDRQLATLEKLLPPGDLFAGNDFSLADCAFPASLHCLAGLAPVFGWSINLPPRLRTVLRVPAVAKVMADYAVAFDDWLATKRRKSSAIPAPARPMMSAPAAALASDGSDSTRPSG